MLGLNLNWGTELLDDLVDSLLTSVSLSNLTAMLGERWDPTAHQMLFPSLPGWATKQQNKHANAETFPQWFSWPLWLLPQRLRVTRKSVTNKDDFTSSCWVGSTHHLAAEHLSGTAKNTLKKIHCQCWQDRKYRQKHLCVWAEYSCTWAAKEVFMVYMPECHHLSMSGWKRRERQQNSTSFNLWKTSITQWHFQKAFCTDISSLKVCSISCSPSVQLALHISTVYATCDLTSPEETAVPLQDIIVPITLLATLMWATGSGAEHKSALHPLQGKITQVS